MEERVKILARVYDAWLYHDYTISEENCLDMSLDGIN